MVSLGRRLGLAKFVQNRALLNPTVLVNSILGDTSIFGLITTVANVRSCQNTMPRSGLIQSITIYHKGGINNLLLGVYSDNMDAPDVLLRGTVSTPLNATQGWQTINLTEPLEVAQNQKIWLAVLFQTNPGAMYDAGTPGRAQGAWTWSSGDGVLLSQYGSSTFSNYRYSLYCSYTYTVPSNIDPDVYEYTSALQTTLSSTEVNLITTLVSSLKSGLGITNLSDFFDYLNIRAGETQEQSLRNLVKNAYHSVAIDSPSWVQDEGFTGNGISSYISVDYVPSAGINFKLNDASHGLYFRVFDRGSEQINGAYGTTAAGGYNTRMSIGSANSGSLHIPLNSAFVSSPNADIDGLYIINRVSPTSFSWFRGINKTEVASDSTNLPDRNLYELALNAGSASYFNTSQIAISFCAKGLTDAHEAVIVDAFEAYMDAKGKGVI